MRTNKMWLLLAFLLTILFNCSRIEEKTLLEESERSLGSNAATSADALALATPSPACRW
jgi:hypothetical protein